MKQRIRRLTSGLLLCFIVFGVLASSVKAQADEFHFLMEEKPPSPRGALLRSLVVPGWGHYYVDSSHWTRGKIHLASDVALILGYVGTRSRINRLENNMFTLARSGSGIDLEGQSRTVELAVSQFNSLTEYNNHQYRTRNWDRVIPVSPQTDWLWENPDQRKSFQDTRDRLATAKNQLPALLTLMVANRVLSGINAFTKARNMQLTPQLALSYMNEFGEPGLTTHLVVRF